MKPRERVLLAIEHREPDRVPLDFWTTPSAYRKLKNYLGVSEDDDVNWSWAEPLKVSEKVLRALNIDFRRVYLKRPKEWVSKKLPNGTIIDEWGRGFKWIGEYLEYVKPPLENISEAEELEEYSWPNPYAEGRTDGVMNAARKLCEETEYAVMGFPTPPSMDLDPALSLIGFKNFLKYIVTNPKLIEAYLDKVCSIIIGFYDVFLDEVKDYIQVIYAPACDVAHQHGMLISPNTWRKIIKPRYAKIVSFIKSKAPSVKVFHHSCGALKPIIPDLIEIGIDILNPIQPLAQGMNSKELKTEYGSRICFHGGIDLQKVMSFRGSIEEVKEEVKNRIRDLAPGGGYILAPAHNLQPDTTPEKIYLMYRYAAKYGVYPISIV